MTNLLRFIWLISYHDVIWYNFGFCVSYFILFKLIDLVFYFFDFFDFLLSFIFSIDVGLKIVIVSVDFSWIFTFGVSKIYEWMCLSFQSCDACWLKIFCNKIKV